MNKPIKYILKLNIKLISFKPLIFIANFIIWLLISLIPLISGLIVKDIFVNLTSSNFNTYFNQVFLLLFVVLLNGLLIREGGVADTLSRFYIGQLVRKSILGTIVEDKKVEIKSNGSIIDILENDVDVLEELVSCEIDFLCRFIFFIGAIIILANINFTLTIFSMIPLVIFSNVIWVLGSKYKAKYSEVRKSTIEYTEFLNEIVENREIIQFLNNRSNLMRRFKDKCNQTKKSSINQNIFNVGINESITLINNFVVVLILFLFIKLYEKNNLSIGDFTLFLSYFGYGYNFLQLFSETYSDIKYAEDSVIRISKLLSCDIKNITHVLINKCNLKGKNIEKLYSSQSITLKNFRLCSDDKCHDISINKGDFIVISGENGSGKSTLVNAIIGYEKYDGKISYYDKHEKENYDMVISYVPQEPHFFNDTIKNNISMFSEDIDVIKSAQIANLADNLFNWDINSSEFVGVDAKRLSEGQRQRLAIARGIANDENIIILDDCLSFLDKDNRKTILQNIINLKKTTIIVSNDEDIKSIADKVIEMKKLKIIDSTVQ